MSAHKSPIRCEKQLGSPPMRRTALKRFRTTALLEGYSYLTLLGIAMPLKYLAGYSIFVKVNGWIHGMLFILFCLFLLLVMKNLRWPLSRAITAFVASLVPFGAFWFDKSLQREDKLLRELEAQA